MSHPPPPGDGRAFTYGPRAAAGRAGKPSTLGIIGLALIGINIIVVIAMSLAGPTVYVVQWTGFESTGSMSDRLWSSLSLGLVLRVVANVAPGLAGWVIGVVATVTNRGRSYGIAAIVLGVVLFIIAATMMFGALLIASLG
jgi:hypothetical protein